MEYKEKASFKNGDCNYVVDRHVNFHLFTLLLDTTNKVKLDPLVLYQGALQTHTNSDDVQFYGLMLTGSLSLDNIYTGNILKMTGSLSSKVEMTGSTGDISFQIIMVAPGEYSG